MFIELRGEKHIVKLRQKEDIVYDYKKYFIR